MNTEQYRQGGWDKVLRLANEASTNTNLQEALRSKKSKDELVEFLKGPVDNYGVPRFVDSDFVDVVDGINDITNLHKLIAGHFWIGLKLDEDFLEMK